MVQKQLSEANLGLAKAQVPLLVKSIENHCLHSTIGILPRNTSLMCGFVYIPSFDSPCSMDYMLHVSSMDNSSECERSASLTLEAKVGFINGKIYSSILNLYC